MLGKGEEQIWLLSAYFVNHRTVAQKVRAVFQENKNLFIVMQTACNKNRKSFGDIHDRNYNH